MNHPYIEFEKTPVWKLIDTAIVELERNRDIQLTTKREYVIGYLCQQLASKRIVTEESLLGS